MCDKIQMTNGDSYASFVLQNVYLPFLTPLGQLKWIASRDGHELAQKLKFLMNWAWFMACEPQFM